MSKIYSIILLCFCISASAQIINIPDPNFKATLLSSSNGTVTAAHIAFDANMNPINLDTNHDEEIQLSEALNVYKLVMIFKGITNLSGIENFTNLVTLDARANEITSFDATLLPNLKSLNMDTNALTSINVAGMTQLEVLQVNNSQLTSIDLNGLSNLTFLGIYGNPISSVSVTHLSTLEFFEGGGVNSNITSVDVSGLQHLHTLYWSDEQLQSVDITGCSAMEIIDIQLTSISELDLTGCPLLNTLWVGFNQLTELDLSQNPLLLNVGCNDNFISSLSIHSTQEVGFNCSNNAITELNISGPFGYIYCNNNQLTTLDLSNATFVSVIANDNNLTELLIKNGQNNTGTVDIQNNPIAFICADESEMLYFQDPANTGLGTYTVNSYCSFEPGGTVYTIQGNAAFDSDSDGCDSEDIFYPNLKYTISDGTVSGAMISDQSGNYSIPLNSGAYTITPILDHPDYFTVSPSTLAVTFPDDGNDLTQDFCVTANGIHKDLEIVIVPIDPARPGFDSDYKIIFKNNGTETLSGSATLAFEDDVIDFVTSAPAVTSASDGVLSWDYTTLAPFESRSILLTMNLNSPTETPAVNNGDQLDFTAVIYPVEDDETTVDNTSGLKQTVVGSFDPNDKTCMEGNAISPEMVGEYVHYTIRFENTGTFPAQNIVVKDMIDQSKFDVSSLIPLAASHSFVTRISDSDKVEFIFENIDLPIADDSNDGYIAFKIKTLPSLETGDIFTNEASIYFDYNFPVVTDPAITIIQFLGTPSPDFSKHFAIYPNPAGNVLNIQPSSGILIKSIHIMNILGQEIIQNADQYAIDVSMLQSGIYIISIETDTGSSAAKFIKR